MSYWEAFILGLIQGITEFLPISSSGHLALLKGIFGFEDLPLLFDIILHFATLIVVVFAFRERIGMILRGLLSFISGKREGESFQAVRICGLVLLATAVTTVPALLFSGFKELISIKVTSLLFIVTGIILLASRWFKGEREWGGCSWRTAILVGAGQGFGVLPGVSRSGATLCAALGAGVERKTAGEFAFLLFIPAVLGALLLEIKDAAHLTSTIYWPTLLVAFFTALVSGFFSIKLLLKVVANRRLWLFSLYLIPLGVVTALNSTLFNQGG